jgi:hypothetical protein
MSPARSKKNRFILRQRGCLYTVPKEPLPKRGLSSYLKVPTRLPIAPGSISRRCFGKIRTKRSSEIVPSNPAPGRWSLMRFVFRQQTLRRTAVKRPPAHKHPGVVFPQ